MGHVRLGKIPTTKKWQSVVSLVANPSSESNKSEKLSDNVHELARETLNAAQKGLERAKQDFGLRYSFYLLTQIVLATRASDWQTSLEKIGIYLSEDATIFDLTTKIQTVIDDVLFEQSCSTDISEIAQQAIGEAFSSLASNQQIPLFGNTRDELISVINQLSTKKGFSQLGQVFFGRFMARFLNFYLSRITAANLNTEQLTNIGELTKFNEALQRHCEQSAKIVYDFCGQWYSKTEFQEGINLDNSSNFMAVALKKLQAELKQQEAEL
ncbi:hypothetical protein [Geminocystis sp. GBBB08]|uniref:hypothetical protein n=1 Tax=Geminocystis sp. GBBB08 TaxID=2604140 RepID=UPI0027E2E1E4|nr:hypothetical protein [Geminocystis sp. GBBB08]MBL1208252.1 hypothetical protein [Geminocystis sp. GBBB08]